MKPTKACIERLTKENRRYAKVLPGPCHTACAELLVGPYVALECSSCLFLDSLLEKGELKVEFLKCLVCSSTRERSARRVFAA
jgi:hypothetical protein